METQVSNLREEASNWRNKKIMEEEHLIAEIHKRPALWNFKLPLSERSLQIKKKLWEEISASMNGKIYVDAFHLVTQVDISISDRVQQEKQLCCCKIL